MSYQINVDNCEMCGACKSACPVSAIKLVDKYYEVDSSLCVGCGSCTSACGFDAIGPEN